jgi:hypothetical protein
VGAILQYRNGRNGRLIKAAVVAANEVGESENTGPQSRFLSKSEARQPDSLEGRADDIGRFCPTIAQSPSMKPFQILCFTTGPRRAQKTLALIN